MKSLNLNAPKFAHASRFQFKLIDLIAIVTVASLLLLAIQVGRDLKNIWLIQFGTTFGGTIWLLAVRKISLSRIHWLCGFLSWWMPVSWMATYAIWQSAFAREEFWIPQLIAIGEVGFVLVRFLIAPLWLAVLTIGIVEFRRKPSWPVVLRTIFGFMPFAALTTMELLGVIQWYVY